MSFNIRPPATFLDSLTNAAVDYLVYVSKPNTDPTDATQRVILRDQNTGEQVDNPFIIGSSGYAKNANGNIIIPYCDELKVAIRFESADGGIQWEARNVESDAFGISGGSAADMMVDQTLDNFQEALATDLTEFDLVFIQSETPDWRDTADGPQNPYYAYKTGSIGDPSTGTAADFYDANGNQWKLVLQPYVYADLNINQNITGVKTFLDKVEFKNSVISDNDSPFYYLTNASGADGFEAGALRIFMSASNNFVTQQRNETGDAWVGIEEIGRNGTKIVTSPVAQNNTFSMSNDNPIYFKNSSGETFADGAFRAFSASGGDFRIQSYESELNFVNRIIVGIEDTAIYDTNGDAVARVESGDGAPEGITVITREKGDDRYLSKSKIWRFEAVSTSSTIGLPSGWTKTVSIDGDIATVLINPNGGLGTLAAFSRCQCTYESIFTVNPKDLFPISAQLTTEGGVANFRIQIIFHKDASVSCTTFDYI